MLEEAATDRAVSAPVRVVGPSEDSAGGIGAGVRGIVLAGVHAWGDCLLEQAVCRPLLPVATQPLISHALRWIRDSGIEHAIICGNSDTDVLRGRLGRGERFGIHLDYFEDVMPRGPAGCVRDAAEIVEADLFVVVDGTVVPRVDLGALIRRHVQENAAVTMVVTDGDRGHEPLGIYVFSRRALSLVPAKGYQDIKETLIPALYARGQRVVSHAVGGLQSVRVTDAASYLGVNMWTTERLFQERKLPAGGRWHGDAWIDSAAHVDSSARFVGPVIVGPNVLIGAGALIVGPCTIGSGSRIGAGVVLSRSAVWDRCCVGDYAIVDQCVLADGSRLEAEQVVRETMCLPAASGSRRLLAQIAEWFVRKPKRG